MAEDRVTIPFTQYMRPNGRQVPAAFPSDAETAALAADIISRGFHFEAEVLTTGEVSLTVFDPEEEVDVAIEVVPNGPEVPKAVKRLVQATWDRLSSPSARPEA